MKKVLKRIAILMCILLAMNSILLFNNVQAVSDELKDDKTYTAKVKIQQRCQREGRKYR